MPSASEVLSMVEYLIKTWGIFIVPIGAFLENSVILGFLFPGVTIIFLSGFVTRTTGESIWLIVVLATLGSFLGDNLDYLIGIYRQIFRLEPGLGGTSLRDCQIWLF